MKKFAALIGSVLMFVVMCFQPLTVNAASSVRTFDFDNGSFPYSGLLQSCDDYTTRLINDDDLHYLYVNFVSTRRNPNGSIPCGSAFFIWDPDDVSIDYNDSTHYYHVSSPFNDQSIKPISMYIEAAWYNGTVHDIDKITDTLHDFYFNDTNGDIHFGSSQNSLSTRFHGIWNYSGYSLVYYEGVSNGFRDPNSLNVEVTFNPALVGQVDRSVTTGDGNTALKQSLFMNVINHSSFPIQYDMVIMKKNIVSVRGGNAFESTLDSDDPSLLSQYNLQYDDDPAFIYYSDDWVYTHGMDSDLQYWDNNTYKYNKATRWHYLAANSSVVQQFDFSQIHLVEGEEYVVTVRAIRNDYGIASEKIVYLASSDPAYPDLKQIQGDDIEIVYTSEFSMLQYNDVVYDPNNSMNGVKPYDGQNGIVDKQRYSWSRNASEDSDGNIDYTSVNHLDNSNSWLHSQYSGVVTNHKKLVSGTQSFSGLNTIISPVVLFVSTTFGFLPSPLQSAFYLGFFAIVVIAVIKKVFA